MLQHVSPTCGALMVHVVPSGYLGAVDGCIQKYIPYYPP